MAVASPRHRGAFIARSHKEHKQPPEKKVGRFSVSRSTATAALRLWIAAALTAFIALNRMAFLDYMDGSTSTRQLRPSQLQTLIPLPWALMKEESRHQYGHLDRHSPQEWSGNIKSSAVKKIDGLNVAWLMSFPNSGTSFTLHMAREASNCTTATNYALEGEIRDEPSVPAIPGPNGENGPWLELIPDRFTDMPKASILTKTHCKGFCGGSTCGPEKTIHTVRSFMMGCLSGTKGVKTEEGMKKLPVVYDASLVTKAIHLFRHPLDNVVARFHLESNVKKARGDEEFGKQFPNNSTGFQKWCAVDDRNRDLLRSHLIDQKLRLTLAKLPCFNEFFRYVQWHNLAFSVTHDMGLPTMILHYHEYAENFAKARDRVLSFVGLPLVGTGVDFVGGKVYRDFYTKEQKQMIYGFLKEFASAETWHEIKDYDFELSTNTSMELSKETA